MAERNVRSTSGQKVVTKLFDQDDDARGFWDDEPTRPFERLSARLKPAGSPPPAPTRAWPSRANQPGGRSPEEAVHRNRTDRARHDDDSSPTRQVPLFDQHMFDDLDPELDQWTPAPHERRSDRPTAPTAPTAPTDNWPASVGEAMVMVVRKGREKGRTVAANIDPLIRRVGAVVLVILLCIPVALALRGGDAHGESLAPDTSTLAVGTVAPVTAPAVPTAETPAAPDTQAPQTAAAPAAKSAAPAAPLVCEKSYTVAKGDYWVLIAAKTNTTLKSVLAANRANKTTLLLPGRTVCLPADATWPTVAAAPSSAAPATAAPKAVCTKKYTVVSGDSWSLIAKRMSVTTTQLLAANNATTKTVLLPGRSICLPSNAIVPAAAKPAAATTTTVKAVVKPPVSARKYTRAEVTQMIRDVFPDDLEEHALVVAERESHLNPYSANFCCYGVFQINYNAHRKWLPSIGVYAPEQLFDPLKNIQAALIIYQRSNSWAPWGG